ncbi:MAG: tRNA-dihydrouridine synthase, partial [Pseudomonadota bacterium]
NYARVYELKKSTPDLTIVLNGGVTSLDDAETHLHHVDGVMLGRAAYQNAYILSDVDGRFFAKEGPKKSRHDVVYGLKEYAVRMQQEGVPLKRLTRHMLGLFQGEPGAKSWRRALTLAGRQSDHDFAVVEQALDKMDTQLV